jgi:hsp70-interacting protein
MTNMKMWEPVISLLRHPQSTAPIQHAALWILGTAVQNNDKAQMAILDFQPLAPLLELLKSNSDGEVRSKAMYAISGILKHNPKAVDLFGKADGWTTLRGALLDPNVSLRRKAAFLVNTLLLQDDSHNGAADVSSTSSSTSQPIAQTTVSTNTTRSTAIAPLDTSSSLTSSAPLEQFPATLRSGVAHPSIAPLLVSSHFIDVLVLSLLSTPLQESIPASILDKLDAVPTAGGPDGDIELREDVDYAEKGSRTCLTFVEKVIEQGGTSKFSEAKGLGQTKELLVLLGEELQGKPIEVDDSSMKYRWQELGFDKTEIESFVKSVKAL